MQKSIKKLHFGLLWFVPFFCLLLLLVSPTSSLASYEISDGSVKALYHFESDGADSSGNGHTGSGVNTPTYSSGKFGNAITLNGTNQYMTVSDHADFRPAGAYTISAWLNTDSLDSQRCWFASAYYGAPNYYGFLSQLQSQSGGYGITQNHCQGSGSNCKIPYTSNISATTWYYITIEYDGTALRIFKDNVLASTTITGYNLGFNATNYVRIGDYNFGGEGGYWDGKIDELAFFNIAIGTTTRDALYNSGAGQEICTTVGCGATTSTSTALSTSTDCFLGTDTTDWELLKNIVLWTFYFLFTTIVISLFWKWISKFKKFTK